MDDIKAKQKKEVKAFESEKRIALKKVKGTSGKGKKGKEALEKAEKEWAEKEQTMKDRHATEVSPISESTTEPTPSEPQSTSTPEPAPQLSAKEKAQAKKMRKRQKEKEKQKAREEEIAYEVANAPNPRALEISVIMELYLGPSNFVIEEVAADGNCLYRAVATQLGQSGGNVVQYGEIRRQCADALWENREEYEPFAELGDSNASTFEEYVEKVRGSSEWGGHLELRALASALKKTIIVYSADSAPLHIKEDHDKEEDGEDVIRLSFHRKYYALGEHYNSVVPKKDNSEEDIESSSS